MNKPIDYLLLGVAVVVGSNLALKGAQLAGWLDGWWETFSWAVVVVAAGAIFLICLIRLAKHRDEYRGEGVRDKDPLRAEYNRMVASRVAVVDALPTAHLVILMEVARLHEATISVYHGRIPLSEFVKCLSSTSFRNNFWGLTEGVATLTASLEADLQCLNQRGFIFYDEKDNLIRATPRGSELVYLSNNV